MVPSREWEILKLRLVNNGKESLGHTVILPALLGMPVEVLLQPSWTEQNAVHIAPDPESRMQDGRLAHHNISGLYAATS